VCQGPHCRRKPVCRKQGLEPNRRHTGYCTNCLHLEVSADQPRPECKSNEWSSLEGCPMTRPTKNLAVGQCHNHLLCVPSLILLYIDLSSASLALIIALNELRGANSDDCTSLLLVPSLAGAQPPEFALVKPSLIPSRHDHSFNHHGEVVSLLERNVTFFHNSAWTGKRLDGLQG